MSLYQIALRNLNRRKGKMVFMLLGLVLGSATVVAIYTTISAMQSEISQQLSDLGANIIITADSGELTFQYGGITIPELIFDTVLLTESDLDTVKAIPESRALLATAPKLVGTVSSGEQNLVIAGTLLPEEFGVKPWLRFSETGSGNMANGQQETDKGMEMDYERLVLERATNVPELASAEVVLGSAVAEFIAAETGDTLELGGSDFRILAVLEETGMAEDNQVLINLSEAQSLLDRAGELTVIEIAADFSQVSEEVLLTQLGEALPHASISGVRQAVMGRDELLASLSRFGLFAGGIVFLTGALVVVLTMSAAVRERTREIGIFRAIGFRGSHIFTIIAMEGLLVSIIGGVIGYHSGLLVARIAGPILTGSTLNSTWQLSILLVTVAATAAAGSLAGFYPALKAARLDPAEALRFV